MFASRIQGAMPAQHGVQRTNLMPSQFVIPETVLIGNPVFNLLKSWIPERNIRV
jgi:hypothetical protein